MREPVARSRHERVERVAGERQAGRTQPLDRIVGGMRPPSGGGRSASLGAGRRGGRRSGDRLGDLVGGHDHADLLPAGGFGDRVADQAQVVADEPVTDVAGRGHDLEGSVVLAHRPEPREPHRHRRVGELRPRPVDDVAPDLFGAVTGVDLRRCVDHP